MVSSNLALAEVTTCSMALSGVTAGRAMARRGGWAAAGSLLVVGLVVVVVGGGGVGVSSGSSVVLSEGVIISVEDSVVNGMREGNAVVQRCRARKWG
mgnify:CR=1 FL=1